MEIKRLNPCGYCKGVINAINLAKKTKDKYPFENIYTLGMIVHNSVVNKELEEYGIITLDDTIKTKEELINEIDDGIIIFTAHGISDEIKNMVVQKGLKYVDATCEDVLKTRKIIISYLDKSYDVIYYGVLNHPEANAIISISSRIHLITSIKDIDSLNIDNTKLFITNQTTISHIELENIFLILKEKYPQAIFENEICNATTLRQKAINGIKEADLLYVVGDQKSNNTKKLFEIAQKKNIKKVFMIKDYSEINDDDLVGTNIIYVTAGASTPPYLIDEVMQYLRSKTS